MNITNIIKSKGFLIAVVALFGCSIVIGAFGVGELVGYRKAKFSYAWSEQYNQNFGGPRRGIFGVPGEAVFPNPYGVDGTVIKVQGDTLIISGRDRRERTIRIDPQTQINSFRPGSEEQRPVVGDHIVVIGDPNDAGQVVAKFIRILP